MTAAQPDTPSLRIHRHLIENESYSDMERYPPFDRAVLSWNADGPADLDVEVDGIWYPMARWSSKAQSVSSEFVDTDTLKLPAPAQLVRFHVVPALKTRVTLVALTFWRSDEPAKFSQRRSPAWGRVLKVPERSQFQVETPPGRLCSPTSLAMLLEFHGVRRATRTVAAGVLDHAKKIYGNWSFNTAYAHQVSGLSSYVCRARNMLDLENEIAAGRPAVVSVRWQPGQLDGAPLPRSDGHLLVVCGFTGSGDVVVNDPAGNPGNIRRVYARKQFFDCWLKRSAGVMYVVGA